MINYTLVNANDVSLEVFDTVGNRVKLMVNSNQTPGKYQVFFDAKADQLAVGIYFIRLTSGNKNFNKRLVVMG
jgi:hypothetical protein